MNKFLKVYYWNKNNYPNIVYCFDCYDKLKKAEIEANKRFCDTCQKELTEEEVIRCEVCWKKEEKETEKRLEQSSRKNKQNSLVSDNSSKITSLKQEISQLENQTNPNQNLLKQKKEELKNLERSREDSKNLSKERLNNQKTEQKSSSKLYLGIGLGIFGLGLVGLVVWLVIKKQNK